MGHNVLHLSTPLTVFHLAKSRESAIRHRLGVWFLGGSVREQGVLEYVPLSIIPWQLARYSPSPGDLFLRCLPSLPRKLAKVQFSKVDILLIDQPKMQGIEDLIAARSVVYRATDLYPQLTGDGRVACVERILVRKADLVVATSQPVLDHLRALATPKNELLLENGVDVEHFSAPMGRPPEYARIRKMIAVYAGALDDRTDLQLVEYLCRQMPNLQVMLIGPISGAVRSAVEGLDNVSLLGPRNYEVLPAYLQHAQIGLLPLSAHPANAGRSPMKLYEYGAAGLPIVSTWTPELARSNLPFVALAESRADFVRKVADLLNDDQRHRQMRLSAIELSGQKGWDAIAHRLLNAIRMASRSAVKQQD
jgi:glycosyltransferase involved in cell wall biosynthesis